MKTNNSLPRLLILAACAMMWCGLNLHAQLGPTITNQPASLTNLPGTTVSFSVGVNGTGPFTYQWQFNGTNLPNNIITTVAGSSNTGYSGDGGPATNANIGDPRGVAFDASGKLYIADYNNNRIRRVDTNGNVTTFAGNGVAAYGGDGGAATNASLGYPGGMAFDAFGNLYITDDYNNRIREVDTKGNITTFAGNGVAAYGGDGGAATNASLGYPGGVAIDAFGNLYIADYNNNRIRRVDTNGIITTVAGNGTQTYSGDGGAATNASLYYPRSVAFDTGGNLFIADQNNLHIRKVDTNGIITTVAGNGSYGYLGDGGAATNASIGYPGGVAFDAFGNLYIADYNNNRIRRVDTNGIITTVVGKGSIGYSGDGGAATNASLYLPYGVTFDDTGNLFIAEIGNSRIRKVATNGIITTVAGIGPYTGDGGAATNASIGSPTSMAFDAFDNLFIADFASRIRKVDTNGIITTVAGNGIPTFAGDGGAATNASLYGPAGVAFDASGNLYIDDEYNNRIRKVGTNGIVTTVLGAGGFANPSRVALDTAGNLYVSDSGANRIFKVGSNGIKTKFAGNGSYGFSGDGGAATNAGIYYPIGLSFDASGNLLIADWQNSRIRKVDANGIITTVAGNGSFSYSGDGGAATNASLNGPQGVASDASGNICIADEYNNRIRRVDTNGIITTVAGNGSGTYAGDGSTATNASLRQPVGVAFDTAGNLFIADLNNNRIREVHSAGLPTFTLNNIGATNAGNYTVVITSPSGSVTSHVATLTVVLPPTVTTQPANVTNVPGSTVSFSVGVDGTGPFSYQWQFNGTNLPNNIITTVAGNGTKGYSGDGGVATKASLLQPYGVAFDAFGNLYVADWDNYRIRKVNTNGIMTTVAGNGSATNAGDGGSAINASFVPHGVAFDPFGNLYIADFYNNRIRKVNTNGIITTVAGNGPTGRTGSDSGDGGAATNASLDLPQGVACDASGNLYLTSGNYIREVTTHGIITTVAGGGSAYPGDGGAATNANVATPWGVSCDASGNIYIVSSDNRVRRVDTNGTITTVAGNGNYNYSGDGGSATNASLEGPSGVAFDTSSNMYIADLFNERIRKVDTGGIITTVAGNGYGAGTGKGDFSGDGGAATNASLNSPQGVALDASGNLYIADLLNSRIRKVWLYAGRPTFTINNAGAINAGNYTVVISSPFGSVTSVVATLTVAAPGVITTQPASQIAVAGTRSSFSAAVAGSGPFGYEWYFAGTNLLQSGTNSTLTLPNVSTNNAGNYTVVVTNNYGSVTSYVATLTVVLPPSITNQPASLTNLFGTTATFSVAVMGTGPFSYQWQFNGTNLPNNIITTVAGNGMNGYSGDGGVATNASLYNSSGVAFDAFGNLYIADFRNNRIRKVDTNGIITTVVGNGSGSYSGDGSAATNASLHFPYGVAFDNSGNLYIADANNNRIRKVDTNGIITTVAGNGTSGYSGDGGVVTNASLHLPSGVAFDGSGNMYIADTGNNRIREVDTTGIITTVAGNGTSGYSGDGGVATNASLRLPYGEAFDAFGNLLLADRNNNCIRKVNTNGIITTVAGNGIATYAGDNGLATNASLNNPWGVAFDNSGNLYIAEYNNNRIRKLDTNGIITTVAGNGTSGYSGDGGVATNASLNIPWGVAFDNSGNLYIADSYNSRIRNVHFAGYPTFTLGNIGATNAGNYAIVIISPYGSVTGLVATLTVIIPPQIITSGTNFGFTTNLANQSGFGFNISGTVGQTIVVDGSTNLVNWTPLYTNPAGGSPASSLIRPQPICRGAFTGPDCLNDKEDISLPQKGTKGAESFCDVFAFFAANQKVAAVPMLVY